MIGVNFYNHVRIVLQLCDNDFDLLNPLISRLN
jgi:hypothetical protein